MEAVGEFEREHISVVALMSGNFLLDVAAHDFRLARQRMLGEKMLGEE